MSASLSALLEQEHHEIDAGIQAYLEGAARGETRRADLARAVSALRRHIYLEEEFLFPPLRSAGMLAPVLVMLREHGEIWRLLDTIDAADLDAQPAAAEQACAGLLELLAAHNAKEEPIIYPQGDAVLSEQAQADLRTFIDAGEMPRGWACAQA
ncbi:MAG: hemerythrin domain-containing protein [Nocardioides sp.]